MSIYALKPKFQNLLRPLVRQLAAKGVTANQVTQLPAYFLFYSVWFSHYFRHFLFFSSLSLFGCFCVWR